MMVASSSLIPLAREVELSTCKASAPELGRLHTTVGTIAATIIKGTITIVATATTTTDMNRYRPLAWDTVPVRPGRKHSSI